MDHRVSFLRPSGQWGNGPAFSQNAGFLPNNTTYGSGPKNNRNKKKNNYKKKNARNGNFSGSKQGDNLHYDPSVPKGPRRYQNQNHRQSQNSYPQSTPHQPRWNQQTSNQGQGYKGNNYCNQKHGGHVQHPSKYQEQPLSFQVHGHPKHPQAPYQHQRPSPFTALNDSFDAIISEAAPPFSQGPFNHFGKAQDGDIEMPDAPPLDQYIYDYQSVSGFPSSAIQTRGYANFDLKVLERILNQALQSQEINVNTLICQVSNEICELKRHNKELSDTVINIFLRSWGVPPQG
jgi:hypothetical protein